jgi:hypothetical protein
LANEKNMNALSGDTVETNGIYTDPYGHQIELKVGDKFPMDPQLGEVSYTLTALSYKDWPDDIQSDALAAEQAHVPVSGVNEEKEQGNRDRQVNNRSNQANR